MVGGTTQVAPTRAFALASFALIVAALGLLPQPAAAASGWEIVLDRPTPNFGAVDFVSDSEGWMPAGAGLLHTTDGGATWTEAAKLTVNDVDFFDQQHGWAVGLSGTIYATSDGGATWRPQDSGTSVHLSEVVSVGPNEAWAVGVGEGFSDVAPIAPPPSAFLHTTDGGATWQQLQTPRGSWFYEIAFAGNHGWALGRACPEPLADVYCTDTNALLRTEDGGTTWSLERDIPPRIRLRFVDEREGWALSERRDPPRFATVIHTADGGLTWEEQLAGDEFESFAALAFRDKSTGWLISTRFSDGSSSLVVRKTNDGGTTWRRVSEISLGTAQYVNSLSLRGGALYLTGNDLALRSADGGASWQPMEQPALSLYGVDFVDRRVGFATMGETLLRTDDAGRNWQTVGPLPSAMIHTEFIDASLGFAASWDCRAAPCSVSASRTDDGGRHWTPVFSHVPATASSTAPIDLRFIDKEHGWLVIENRTVFLTDDGGTTWEQRSVGEGNVSVTDAELVDAGFAWALVYSNEPGSSRREVRRSQDGGRTWQTVQITPSDDPQFVAFANRDHGWYVATRCNGLCHVIVAATEDGGATWTETNLGPLNVYDLLFVDRLNGWLSGQTCGQAKCTGQIFHTADGGRTWLIQASGESLTGSIVFVDSETGWLLPVTAIGLGGGPPHRTLLYHTTDGGGGPIGEVPPDFPHVGGGFDRSRTDFALPLVLGAAGAIAFAASFALRRRRS